MRAWAVVSRRVAISLILLQVNGAVAMSLQSLGAVEDQRILNTTSYVVAAKRGVNIVDKIGGHFYGLASVSHRT